MLMMELEAPPSVSPEDVEAAVRERRVAEQDILRQSLQEKEEQIQTLTQKVEALEALLERFSALRSAPVTPPTPLRRPFGPPPRRWSAHR